ncbi:hypothetical protein RclHR1_04180013 [Rhizophagus clarus]|uniref:S-adenosyl-L-methionine-dependent methyltransferase n=1 Tax=Rhizophagus clarus TaxID=94130 RepID=A0A2Z6RFG0_9GLOM|nr:hypothetical protein RclHR1_04180013 [Rhizophagus clarus]GES97823.1 S-adenosyl-L-methionine-dependent methyltransferase [Rhizophagus clarus]
MGVQQSKKMPPKIHHKQKSFASESELKHFHLITSELNNEKDLDVKYDSKTIDRIVSQQYLLKHIWKGNYSSPIKDSLESGRMNALEIKCGPGTWVLDMATEFSKCSFTGIDLIPIFPSEIRPKNTKFVLANKSEYLPFSPSTFSYVHINFIEHMHNENSFYQNDIINEIINIMKCDAWLEITTWNMEFENEKVGHITQKLISAMKTCFENHISLSKMISSLPNCDQLKNTNILTNNIPVGKWGGIIGELVMEDLLITFKQHSNIICKKLEITPKQYDSYLKEFVKEIEENQTVFKTCRFFGQKI